eukprot:1180147-Prorocentrum_minimum.AAC.1
MHTFHQVVAPKRIKLAEAQAVYKAVMASLEEKQAQLRGVQLGKLAPPIYRLSGRVSPAWKSLWAGETRPDNR